MKPVVKPTFNSPFAKKGSSQPSVQFIPTQLHEVCAALHHVKPGSVPLMVWSLSHRRTNLFPFRELYTVQLPAVQDCPKYISEGVVIQSLLCTVRMCGSHQHIFICFNVQVFINFGCCRKALSKTNFLISEKGLFPIKFTRFFFGDLFFGCTLGSLQGTFVLFKIQRYPTKGKWIMGYFTDDTPSRSQNIYIYFFSNSFSKLDP